MLPFLKASGLLEEVGRNVYVATSAAKAWLETENDLDFVRILHANMRFVGEAIRAANENIVHNEIYAQAKQHGLNAEKARWVTGFLLEAGLLEEPQYLHLKATPAGRQFVLELPLVNAEDLDDTMLKADRSDIKGTVAPPVQEESSQLTARLYNAACDPYTEGKASGIAFEEAIAEIFNFMGFHAKRKFLDFPVNNKFSTDGFNSGNQRIHHTPLVVKTNLVPVFVIAGYTIKLIKLRG